MSPQLPWLTRLHEVLRKVRLPVADLVLADHVLELELDLRDHPPLVALIRPVADQLDGFAKTSRFVVGYRGAADLSLQQRRTLELLVEVLKRIEQRMPERLDGAGGVFTRETSEESRFLRVFRFCTLERSRSENEEITELLVRATPLCNQQCPFCSAPEHATPDSATLCAMIREAARVFPGVMLSLTGGEPTLRRTFLDELRLAMSLEPIAQVQVQTNAVGFARKIDPKDIEPSPRLTFFVSLHALDPAVYDRCTGTTGQLPLAIEGIHRLAAAGHAITINCVINAANFDHLDRYVQDLGTTFSSHDRIDLHLSTLICPESRPEAASFLVPYPALARRLRHIAQLAQSAGLPLQSLRSSTHASMPACMLDDVERDRGAHRPRILEHETGFEDFSRPWVKAAGCRSCRESPNCLGVPRPYAQRFGLDDLHPIEED